MESLKPDNNNINDGKTLPSNLEAEQALIGSILVIPKQYATTEPAADPLPGPTDTPIFFDAEMKSWTIKKYPG